MNLSKAFAPDYLSNQESQSFEKIIDGVSVLRYKLRK